MVFTWYKSLWRKFLRCVLRSIMSYWVTTLPETEASLIIWRYIKNLLIDIRNSAIFLFQELSWILLLKIFQHYSRSSRDKLQINKRNEREIKRYFEQKTRKVKGKRTRDNKAICQKKKAFPLPNSAFVL